MRRAALLIGLFGLFNLLSLCGLAAAADVKQGTAPSNSDSNIDPYASAPWPDMRREFLGSAPLQFDARVQVQGPAFAEDPMNVPIGIRVDPALGAVRQIVVLVDRNPIRRVLVFAPLQALPALAFRFKLEQASPVRAAVQTADGHWHVGSTWVDSAGGGCTVSGASRKDGSWAQTLGEVSGRLFSPATDQGPTRETTRLRLRVMHPMDTGLVGGVPAFYLNRLSLRDGGDRELARLETFEPISENPVFSFDFAEPPPGGVRIVGSDNNGNRIASPLP
ncbi:quinoprotein dehydrogenase-associated SoxYZ-like carrier [Ideonella sp.]|uniref:quinoprotein dehydrogenase-associated SoxYZ-like carrier n=1 Tax=Ideonella sp. TaxID=1929293 RepID=UPI003BB532B8